MISYNIIVYINDGTEVILPVKYDKEYELRKDVTSIGINGILQKGETDYLYYPSHKIDKIEVKPS